MEDFFFKKSMIDEDMIWWLITHFAGIEINSFCLTSPHKNIKGGYIGLEY